MKSACSWALGFVSVAGCAHPATTTLVAVPETRASLAPRHPIASEIVGRLEEGDAIADDDSFYDEYPVELRPGWSLHVVLRSDDFDTYLAVLDADGHELVSNDDDASLGADGLDSQLTHTATDAGVVTVRATSYSGGSSGTYRLTFEAGPDVPLATYSDDEEMECCEGDPGEDYEEDDSDADDDE